MTKPCVWLKFHQLQSKSTAVEPSLDALGEVAPSDGSGTEESQVSTANPLYVLGKISCHARYMKPKPMRSAKCSDTDCTEEGWIIM